MKSGKRHGRAYRLPEYDYAQNGCCFVTICAKDRKPIFGRIICFSDIVGLDAHIEARSPHMQLSKIGFVVEKYIKSANRGNVIIDHYAIMPNHVHLLIRLGERTNTEDASMWASRPTISSVVRSLKTLISKEVGSPVFQPSFYDHVIRDKKDYLTRWQYIEDNPAKWAEDEYYSKL